jgi:molybdate transport system substrate-binding protein
MLRAGLGQDGGGPRPISSKALNCIPGKIHLSVAKPLHPLALTAALWASAALACACSSAPPAGITVAAAASLTPAFEKIGPAFTDATGIPVTFSFGATGNLAQQIRNGAPFDVFAAADASHIDTLIGEGQLLAGTRRVFALGRLVLVVNRQSGLAVYSLADLPLAADARVVIADPLIAPYGLAAQQALQRSGVLPLVQPRLVYAESIAQAAQIVISGNAPLGLLADSVAANPQLEVYAIDPALYDPIEHVAAANRASTHPEQAERFLAYLTSPAAQVVLTEFHLSPPETSQP